MELSQMKCTACQGGELPLTDSDIVELYPQVAESPVVKREGIRRLERVFRSQDSAEAPAFTNETREIAEEEDHHPAVPIEWGQSQSLGGRTKSGACIATISSW